MVKLAQCAVDLGNYREAQLCANCASSVLPDNVREQKKLPKRIWRWHAIRNVFGQVLLRNSSIQNGKNELYERI